MKRVVILYALALAAGAFALQWLQYNYLVRVVLDGNLYWLIAVAFAGLGVWAGMRLARRPASRNV
jgi:NarL family two-component system response regulator LiaR